MGCGSSASSAQCSRAGSDAGGEVAAPRSSSGGVHPSAAITIINETTTTSKELVDTQRHQQIPLQHHYPDTSRSALNPQQEQQHQHPDARYLAQRRTIDQLSSVEREQVVWLNNAGSGFPQQQHQADHHQLIRRKRSSGINSSSNTANVTTTASYGEGTGSSSGMFRVNPATNSGGGFLGPHHHHHVAGRSTSSSVTYKKVDEHHAVRLWMTHCDLQEGTRPERSRRSVDEAVTDRNNTALHHHHSPHTHQQHNNHIHQFSSSAGSPHSFSFSSAFSFAFSPSASRDATGPQPHRTLAAGTTSSVVRGTVRSLHNSIGSHPHAIAETTGEEETADHHLGESGDTPAPRCDLPNTYNATELSSFPRVQHLVDENLHADLGDEIPKQQQQEVVERLAANHYSISVLQECLQNLPPSRRASSLSQASGRPTLRAVHVTACH